MLDFNSREYCESIAEELERAGLSCQQYQQLDDAAAFCSYVRDGRVDEMLEGLSVDDVLSMAEQFIADVRASL